MRLEAKNVSFRYGPRLPWVLRGQSVAVAQGERLAVLAPSGYGKTTLALLLAGYLQPAEGAVLLDGKPLPRAGVRPVQMIHQHPEKAINPRWRLKKVLAESGPAQPELLAALGIAPAWLERYPRELSGGELQRFCVARALLSGAPFLICDEISTMLDVITQAQLWQVICAAAQQRRLGVVAITHNQRLAARVSDRLVDLRHTGSVGE